MSMLPVAVPLRFADTDALGHVNHATVLTLLEAGRVPVLSAAGITGADYVIRRAEVDYLREIPATARTVHVVSRVESLGRTSLTLRQALTIDDAGPAVECRAVLVLWDPAARATRPIGAHERTALEALIDEGTLQ